MNPLIAWAFFLPLQWFSAQLGAYCKRRTLERELREDLSVILAAALTLLGLVIGFSFSMAIGHYDQRLRCEAAEANAIGTALLRANLLPAVDGMRLRDLLISYTAQRVLFYRARNEHESDQAKAATARLQADLWSTVRASAVAQQTPIIALAVAGVNDVLSSQDNTQAAWLNRIPLPAWMLIGTIAVISNVLLGYTSRYDGHKVKRFLILPILVSSSLFLIGDLDSPYGGLIHIVPRNLMNISQPM